MANNEASDRLSTDTIVSTKDLCYSIGEQKILYDVDMEIKASGITGLLGPNGSGKTTLFKILSLILRPTSGSIEFSRNFSRGIIFQSTNQNLIPWKDTIENIMLPYFSFERARKKEIEEKAYSLIKKLRLEGILRKIPGQLSGGEKQLVSIVRWLVQPPEILFIDEGWSMLDVVQKDRIHDLIKVINQEFGTTIFLVSHDPSELTFLCDSVYLLSDSPGRMVDCVKFDDSLSFAVNDELLWNRAKKVFPSMQKVLY